MISIDPNEPSDGQYPEQILQLQELWERFERMYLAAETESAEISRIEDLYPESERLSRVFVWRVDQGTHAIVDIARNLVRRIAQFAEVSLPPPGATLTIDLREIEDLWLEGNEETGWRRRGIKTGFGAISIWKGLESRYGGGRAKEMAYCQNADRIVSVLGLARAPQMKTVGAAVEISMRVFTEVPYSGPGRRLSTHSEGRFAELMRGLNGFLSWMGEAEQSETRSSLNLVFKEFTRIGRRGFSSRERRSCKLFEFTFFYERIGLRMSSETADKLNEFVSTYSKMLLEMRAGAA